MFCKNCGAELPENASVCPKCGTGIHSPAESIAKETVSTPSAHVKSTPKKKVFLAAAVLIVVLGALAV